MCVYMCMYMICVCICMCMYMYMYVYMYMYMYMPEQASFQPPVGSASSCFQANMFGV